MRSEKHWIKKWIIVALILIVAGVGAGWAAGMDRSKYDQAFNQVKQSASAGPYMPWNNGTSFVMQNDHHVRGGMHGGFQKHHILNPGMAVGGIILGAIVLYWVFKRRKRPGGDLASNAVTLIPSTSDFLDQWEKNHLHTKESK